MAILAVLAYHCFALVPKPEGSALVRVLDQISQFGWMGVDLFFVLSGFLITRILLKDRESPSYFKAFYARRTARIIPLYLLWLIAYFMVKHFTGLSTAPHGQALVGTAIPDWSHFAFVQNMFMVSQDSFGNGWLGVSWSLCVEEQFYLLFPFVVRLVRPHLLLGLLLASVPIAFGVRYACLLSDNAIGAVVVLPCRMDALASGAILAWLMQYRRSWLTSAQLARWIPGSLIVTGAVLLVLHVRGIVLLDRNVANAAYFLWIEAVALGIVWLAVDRRFRAIHVILSSRSLRFFGDTSFFLYLFHRPIVGCVSFVLGVPADWATPAGVGAMLTGLGILLVAAWLSLHRLERPLTRWAARNYRYHAVTTAIPSETREPQLVQN